MEIAKRPIICRVCSTLGDTESGFTSAGEHRPDGRAPFRCSGCGAINLIKIRLTLDKYYVAEQATPMTA